jgi:hypothetical protein
MMARIFNLDGHGHDDDRGLGKLWISGRALHKATPGLLSNVLVVTFSVAPEMPYCLSYDAFGLLTTAPDFEDWTLQAYRSDPVNP